MRSDNPDRPSDSTSTYDVNGHLITVSETHWPEDDPKASAPLVNLERFFSNDANGIVLKKVQEGNVLKQLVVQGNVVTSYGKGVDADKPYDDQGKTNYIAQGDFGLTYQAITSRTQAGSTSTYTVRDGDTLGSIAQSAWGDASLWWKIAIANGLAATGPDEAMPPGQTITLPGQVGGLHNNADTFKPYEPGDIVGDTTPNMPGRGRGHGSARGIQLEERGHGRHLWRGCVMLQPLLVSEKKPPHVVAFAFPAGQPAGRLNHLVPKIRSPASPSPGRM